MLDFRLNFMCCCGVGPLIHDTYWLNVRCGEERAHCGVGPLIHDTYWLNVRWGAERAHCGVGPLIHDTYWLNVRWEAGHPHPFNPAALALRLLLPVPAELNA